MTRFAPASYNNLNNGQASSRERNDLTDVYIHTLIEIEKKGAPFIHNKSSSSSSFFVTACAHVDILFLLVNYKLEFNYICVGSTASFESKQKRKAL